MLYGEARVDDRPALILLDIGGFMLCDPKAGHLTKEELQRLLNTALGALVSLGVSHDDNKLDNYHLVGDKIMVLDLECTDETDPDHPTRLSLFQGHAVAHLTDIYIEHQKTLRYDGLID